MCATTCSSSLSLCANMYIAPRNNSPTPALIVPFSVTNSSKPVSTTANDQRRPSPQTNIHIRINHCRPPS
ncbi:hypothetical protein BDR22DRAFT_158864 [Usnea florida]